MTIHMLIMRACLFSPARLELRSPPTVVRVAQHFHSRSLFQNPRRLMKSQSCSFCIIALHMTISIDFSMEMHVSPDTKPYDAGQRWSVLVTETLAKSCESGYDR